MDLRFKVLPCLQAIAKMESGKIFSFVYKTPLDSDRWSTKLSMYYKGESKATMLVELDTIVQGVEDQADIINHDLKVELAKAIDDCLPKFNFFIETYPDAKDEIEKIIDRLQTQKLYLELKVADGKQSCCDVQKIKAEVEVENKEVVEVEEETLPPSLSLSPSPSPSPSLSPSLSPSPSPSLSLSSSLSQYHYPNSISPIVVDYFMMNRHNPNVITMLNV